MLLKLDEFWADYEAARAKYKNAKLNLRNVGHFFGLPAPNFKNPKLKTWLYIGLYEAYIDLYKLI